MSLLKVIINRIKRMIFGYRYTKYSHCHDPQLLELLEDFKNKKFNQVENKLINFKSDYRDFGISTIAELQDETLINSWINESKSDVAQITLAEFKLNQGWKYRGVGSIDTVNEEDYKNFQKCIKEAKELLLELLKKTPEFNIEKIVRLLTIYKAIDIDREEIHKIFKAGLEIAPQHIGLHIKYFQAISPKWGGTKEEIHNYMNNFLPNEPKLIEQSVLAMYYWDLIKVYDVDDKNLTKEIVSFINEIDHKGLPKDNLYRFPLYLSLQWLCSSNAENLERKYYRLAKRYWDDNCG